MKYRTIVNFFKANGIDTWEVVIAIAVDSLDYKDIDEDEFEQLCIHTSYLSLKDPNHLNAECIAKMLYDLRKSKSWDEIDHMSVWNLLAKAINYE